ncbi:type VII secretion protein EccB [Streptomyces sp. CB03238]|uniref:type VII secretion protein EccB n=1 Tax=Streptomyces sp. CB03238 TaxID=1907777 RepID=UPI000A121E4F|nr:type VII secretion protein EccB [Streptomyces sp. CB03238]ORT60540.1 type VII secretion protein EccB [Streptomyces sp. CB03238]
MATTREQAESHAYENRRQVTSLIQGRDEAQHDPRRRLNRALAGGSALAVLAMAGFGTAGWLGAGSGPDLPGDGAVVVSGSGDRYVITDGVAHPALNLSSALLVGGGKEPVKVRAEALDAAPRGLPVGIPAAPDALPPADRLSTAPWTVCTVPAHSGSSAARTELFVSVPDAAPSGAARSATVLVSAPDKELWLLTEGRRHALSPAMRDALGLQRAEPAPLSDDILATVPEGPAIEAPEPPPAAGDAPGASGLPDGAAVGDLVTGDPKGPHPQYYQVRRDGLLAVSALTYAVLRTDSGVEHMLSAADLARASRSEESDPGQDAWPEQLPRAEEPARDQPVCVSTTPGGASGDAAWQATVHLPAQLPRPQGLKPVAAADSAALGELDRLYIPAGRGALVRAATATGPGGTHTLITDSGTAYPLSSADAVKRLRYDPDASRTVPKSFVRLLPEGPVLDPEAAAEEHTGRTTEDQ